MMLTSNQLSSITFTIMTKLGLGVQRKIADDKIRWSGQGLAFVWVLLSSNARLWLIGINGYGSSYYFEWGWKKPNHKDLKFIRLVYHLLLHLSYCRSGKAFIFMLLY